MAQLFGVAKLGRDVEVRYLQNGDPVANLALAFSYGKKGQDNKRPTQWVEASLWGARAEALAPYLVKGQSVGVTIDEIHIDTFQKSDGSQSAKLVGRISNIEFAGGPPAGTGQSTPKPDLKPAAAPPASIASMSDDIPF